MEYTWKTGDGREVPLRQLSYDHLANIIRGFERTGRARKEPQLYEALQQEMVSRHMATSQATQTAAQVTATSAPQPKATFIKTPEGKIGNHRVDSDDGASAPFSPPSALLLLQRMDKLPRPVAVQHPHRPH